MAQLVACRLADPEIQAQTPPGVNQYKQIFLTVSLIVAYIMNKVHDGRWHPHGHCMYKGQSYKNAQRAFIAFCEFLILKCSSLLACCRGLWRGTL